MSTPDTYRTVKLNHRVLGKVGQPALMILHGLLGSHRNWGRLANRLAEHYRVYIPDLRNHGDSPHTSDMDYPLMAADVLALMDRQGVHSVRLLGHSMGGKVAMWLALTRPERVQRLMVVDIAPVRYAHDFSAIFKGLHAVENQPIHTRQEADACLSDYMGDSSVRQFLLQNLLHTDGQYHWRMPLNAIEQALPKIAAFPETASVQADNRPALFIGGTQSDYLLPQHYPCIQSLFPQFKLEMIAGAGHWLHVEQPGKLLAAIQGFDR